MLKIRPLNSLYLQVLAAGQWGLDPAYAASQNLKFPGSFSLDYVFNPFLGIDGSPASGDCQVEVVELPPGAPPKDLGQQEPLQKTFQARPKDYDPKSRKGQFDLKLRIDQEVNIEVQGARIRYTVVRGREPSDMGSEYSQEIPPAIFRKFEVKKEDGQGNVLILEKPSGENDFTLRLRFLDPKGGDDRYHARIKWERERLLSRPARKPKTLLSAAPVPPQPPPQATTPMPQDPAGAEVFSTENDPNDYNRDRDGEFEFKGRVDGSVVLNIRHDRVFVRVLNGQPLKVEHFSFSQPLPATAFERLELVQKDGRGQVLLQERPWEGNGTTAVVQISAPKGGDDRYRFRLKWER